MKSVLGKSTDARRTGLKISCLTATVRARVRVRARVGVGWVGCVGPAFARVLHMSKTNTGRRIEYYLLLKNVGISSEAYVLGASTCHAHLSHRGLLGHSLCLPQHFSSPRCLCLYGAEEKKIAEFLFRSLPPSSYCNSYNSVAVCMPSPLKPSKQNMSLFRNLETTNY